jgi:predicted nucleic acid-binding protein
MPYLVDSNILIRIAKKNDPDRLLALSSLQRLRAKSEILYYTTQILAEFWSVSTRPTTARGGLGLSIQSVERKTKIIERFFQLLPDSVATHQEWRRMITAYAVSGVQVHDARLAAVARIHATHLLTFNRDDFKRFPDITVISPDEVG